MPDPKAPSGGWGASSIAAWSGAVSMDGASAAWSRVALGDGHPASDWPGWRAGKEGPGQCGAFCRSGRRPDPAQPDRATPTPAIAGVAPWGGGDRNKIAQGARHLSRAWTPFQPPGMDSPAYLSSEGRKPGASEAKPAPAAGCWRSDKAWTPPERSQRRRPGRLPGAGGIKNSRSLPRILRQPASDPLEAAAFCRFWRARFYQNHSGGFYCCAWPISLNSTMDKRGGHLAARSSATP